MTFANVRSRKDSRDRGRKKSRVLKEPNPGALAHSGPDAKTTETGTGKAIINPYSPNKANITPKSLRSMAARRLSPTLNAVGAKIDYHNLDATSGETRKATAAANQLSKEKLAEKRAVRRAKANSLPITNMSAAERTAAAKTTSAKRRAVKKRLSGG